MALAVITFCLALAAIASERFNYAKVALLGAAAVVAGGALNPRQAFEAVDFNTLGLVVGMMLLVHAVQRTGVFDYVAIRAAQLSGGEPFRVTISLAATTALLSAFVPNLSVILLVVPVTFLLADTLDVDPIPLVLIEVVAANVGGTATLIGDPPNILIGGATGLSFAAFALNLAPVVAVAFVATAALLYLRYREELRVEPAARRRVMGLDAAAKIADRPALGRAVAVLALTIAGFLAAGPLGLAAATVALAGAAAALAVTGTGVGHALARVEWATVLFFGGLFVMVGALEETGAIHEVAGAVAGLTGGDRTAELLGILWLGGAASGVIDNIPFTAAAIPVVAELRVPGDDAYWWALALGASLGGNATLFAGAANIAAAGLAQRAGRPIGYLTFLKVGLPATALTLLISTAYIALRYL